MNNPNAEFSDFVAETHQGNKNQNPAEIYKKPDIKPRAEFYVQHGTGHIQKIH